MPQEGDLACPDYDWPSQDLLRSEEDQLLAPTEQLKKRFSSGESSRDAGKDALADLYLGLLRVLARIEIPFYLNISDLSTNETERLESLGMNIEDTINIPSHLISKFEKDEMIIRGMASHFGIFDEDTSRFSTGEFTRQSEHIIAQTFIRDRFFLNQSSGDIAQDTLADMYLGLLLYTVREEITGSRQGFHLSPSEISSFSEFGLIIQKRQHIPWFLISGPEQERMILSEMAFHLGIQDGDLGMDPESESIRAFAENIENLELRQEYLEGVESAFDEYIFIQSLGNNTK